MNSPRSIASKRGKKVSDIFGNKETINILMLNDRIKILKLCLLKVGLKKIDQKKTLTGLGLNRVGKIRELKTCLD